MHVETNLCPTDYLQERCFLRFHLFVRMGRHLCGLRADPDKMKFRVLERSASIAQVIGTSQGLRDLEHHR